MSERTLTADFTEGNGFSRIELSVSVGFTPGGIAYLRDTYHLVLRRDGAQVTLRELTAAQVQLLALVDDADRLVVLRRHLGVERIPGEIADPPAGS